MLTVTVSQLNRYVKAVLEDDPKLSDLYIKGEIANFTRHFRSGHLYFSLRDENAGIKAVMFRSHAEDLRFDPEDGMAVLVRARVGVYERDGAYQLYVTDIQPDGAGAYAVAFEQLKKKLSADGLFDERHKKPLPPFPKRIGVVTSETGAALHDITNVLSRRYPLATVVLSPATVQGREAPAALAKALRTLDTKGNCDVIIIGRGGGSTEDLWCFNDESLARAVFDAGTPVVSAVGHEVDFTICDFVADLRAPTPSAAAELVSPDLEETARKLAMEGIRLRTGASGLLMRHIQRLDTLAAHPMLAHPMAYVSKQRERLDKLAASDAFSQPVGNLRKRQEKLDFFSQSLYNKKRIIIREMMEKLKARGSLLDSLSPLRVLGRGYCVAYRGENTVATVDKLKPGMELSVRFHDGVAVTEVKSLQK